MDCNDDNDDAIHVINPFKNDDIDEVDETQVILYIEVCNVDIIEDFEDGMMDTEGCNMVYKHERVIFMR